MKVIQVPMDEELLKAVNRRAKSRRSSRSAFIREACQQHLERLNEEELERQYVEGYRRMPEGSAGGKLGEGMAQEVWPKEDWDAAW